MEWMPIAKILSKRLTVSQEDKHVSRNYYSSRLCVKFKHLSSCRLILLTLHTPLPTVPRLQCH